MRFQREFSNHQGCVFDLRAIGIAEVPMFGHYQYTQAQRGLPPHLHPGTMEICYLAKGKQLYRIGQRDYVLTGGDVFVTLPDEQHSTGEAPQEKGTLYWVQFFLPRGRARFLQSAPADSQRLVQQLRHIPHRHFVGQKEIQRILDDILRTCEHSTDPLRRLLIQNRLMEFLLRVLDCSRRRPKPSVSPAISNLLRYVEVNAPQTLPLPALAARVGLSLPRFKARFKHEVGIPPAEYVLRCKIEAAKKCLALPNANVTRVALELNFSSSQYFATVFRRYTGRTPREFSRAAVSNRR